MKLLLRINYALLFMGFSIVLNASTGLTTSIRTQKGKSFSVHLNNLKNTSYSIQLSDERGIVFIKEKVENQTDYLKLFDLKNLPVGNYQLSIENNVKVIIQDIKVLKQKLTIDPAAKREITKPTIQYQSTFLNLNMFHSEAGLINVIIRDHNKTEIYQEEISKKGNIYKRFRIKDFPAGNYEVVVITKHYTYEQKFLIGKDHRLYLENTSKQQKKLTEKSVNDKEINKTLSTHEAAMKSRLIWLNNKN